MKKGSHHTEKVKEKMSKTISKARKGKFCREKSGNWKGGFTKGKEGYILFKIPKGCRFSSMKDSQGYALVQRLTMAAFLQRPLKPKEVVHHINGDMEDNRIENLELMTQSKHCDLHNELRKKNIKGETKL